MSNRQVTIDTLHTLNPSALIRKAVRDLKTVEEMPEFEAEGL